MSKLPTQAQIDDAIRELVADGCDNTEESGMRSCNGSVLATSTSASE